MATVQALVRRALRLIGVVEAQEQLSAEDLADGVEAFRRLMGFLPTQGVGGGICEELVEADFVVDNQFTYHLTCRIVGPIIITLPDDPFDGQRVRIVDAGANFDTHNVTIASGKKLINGATANIVLSAAGANVTYMYRSDLADWRPVSTVTSGSDSPYPEDLDWALEAMLAVAYAPEFGRSVNPDVRALADEGLKALQGRYMHIPCTESARALRPSSVNRGYY